MTWSISFCTSSMLYTCVILASTSALSRSLRCVSDSCRGRAWADVSAINSNLVWYVWFELQEIGNRWYVKLPNSLKCHESSVQAVSHFHLSGPCCSMTYFILWECLRLCFLDSMQILIELAYLPYDLSTQTNKRKYVWIPVPRCCCRL